MKGTKALRILGLGILWLGIMATPALAAYSSHQNDQDINDFLAVYAFARSSKLNDCSLCHPGGSITQNGKTTTYGSCDYCHLTYGLQTPHGNVPLNAYGQAYKGAGRNQNAIKGIESADSDVDSFSNLTEITALTFPGDKKDYPGLSPAPVVVMNLERILKLKGYSQFYLNNASKSTDWYARYAGARMSDLLKQVGMRSEATQITVFAPDGFSKTFQIDAPDPQTPSNIQYDVMGTYPRP
jgi:hypothetical protein